MYSSFIILFFNILFDMDVMAIKSQDQSTATSAQSIKK
jgi:hypothetical protein